MVDMYIPIKPRKWVSEVKLDDISCAVITANAYPVAAILTNPRRETTRWICEIVFKAKKCFPLHL
jgi:hypothetical protein